MRLLATPAIWRHTENSPPRQQMKDLRITTHLEYVEEELRKNPDRELTVEQQKNRALMIDLLHNYWTAGIFPRNQEHAGSTSTLFYRPRW